MEKSPRSRLVYALPPVSGTLTLSISGVPLRSPFSGVLRI